MRQPDPPPPGADGEALIELHRSAAKIAIRNYAEHHEDFCDVMADAALDHPLFTRRTSADAGSGPDPVGQGSLADSGVLR